MKKIKLQVALGLIVLSCIFGVFIGLNNHSTTIAQASARVTASQQRQINKVNAKLSKSQKNAKNWIAYRESGYNYTARNGRCYGRYQLLRSYLHGNLSPVNQEKRANAYVASRYHSWTNAKKFWQHHHWY
ncbi:transglycosylase [Lactobacillus sp. CBA3605]|uniref:aggregation-promoting factor C-terminal-like domain-containing protein n=1 Tax=Lactobacillus sp. CBA3605 TaxID=2099788 RepID=UPI000CFE2565|nr:transglycosylase [Lactobacillus sp. CBA3605]AVK61205.1 transglycosylase [Lactobacillus sp. CBA3605]